MRRELVLIAIPKPVNEERRTERIAFTLSCELKLKEWREVNFTCMQGYFDSKVEKVCYTYYSVKDMSKKDHNGKLKGSIRPYVTPAHCQHHVEVNHREKCTHNYSTHSKKAIYMLEMPWQQVKLCWFRYDSISLTFHLF